MRITSAATRVALLLAGVSLALSAACGVPATQDSASKVDTKSQKQSVLSPAVRDTTPPRTEPPTTTTPPTTAKPTTTTAAPAKFVAAAPATTAKPYVAPKAPVTTAYTPPPPPPPSSGSSCHPSYSPCIADTGTDVDCAGGSGDGPRYVQGPVQVHGTDEYRLDNDGDGVGCTS